MNTIDDYKRAFSKLRQDSSAARWPISTNHRAPYKPFLLLSVLDLIAQGIITNNFVTLDADLMDTFDLYWIKVMGHDHKGNIVMPFYHLKSDGFWHLVPQSGMEQVLTTIKQVPSLRQLNQLVAGVQLNEALFTLLLQANSRDTLRQVLIEHYFPPETRTKLVEVGRITAESFEYSRELLDRLRGTFRLQEAPTEYYYHTESRSTGFRRVVVKAYDHTCAICGIRIRTPEGRTAVAAAHIVPWSFSHNDDPRNGLALCGLHHWTFDQGMLGISPEYQIQVSPIVDREDSATEMLRILHNQTITLPKVSYLLPAKTALKWHINNIFRVKNASDWI
ncbi:MAG: HNH endonuclease [Chloroflexota bacterium]